MCGVAGKDFLYGAGNWSDGSAPPPPPPGGIASPTVGPAAKIVPGDPLLTKKSTGSAAPVAAPSLAPSSDGLKPLLGN